MADDQNKQVEEKQSEEATKSEEVSSDVIASEAKQSSSDTSPDKIATVTPDGGPRNDKKDEPAKEEPKVEKSKKAPKPVSANLEKIIATIEKLSVLELADLVHALEDRFGVSASAPVMATSPAAASPSAGEPQEEKTTFNVILSAAGANKIAVIKAVRELVPTLGLKEAKDLVEAAPKPVLESVNKQTAEEAKTKLTAVGGTVELQ